MESDSSCRSTNSKWKLDEDKSLFQVFFLFLFHWFLIRCGDFYVFLHALWLQQAHLSPVCLKWTTWWEFSQITKIIAHTKWVDRSLQYLWQFEWQTLFVSPHILRRHLLPGIVGWVQQVGEVWNQVVEPAGSTKPSPHVYSSVLWKKRKKRNCPPQTRPWLEGFVCPDTGNAVFPCGASVWNVWPCTCIPKLRKFEMSRLTNLEFFSMSSHDFAYWAASLF